ncbi:SseB family protein [Mucilaginibacter sp.]
MNLSKTDNTKLITLLNAWSKDPVFKNYEKVMNELVNGNSFLMLPSQNADQAEKGWRRTSKGEKLSLTCIFEVDGQKIIGGFTDKEAIVKWAKGAATYMSMRSQDVLNLCEREDIYKIVINSDSPNIFLA